MGLSNEMHPIHDEESLPLYSNLEYDEATSSTPLVLPEATATPDVVREFLVRVLVNRRSLPLDQARRIAARWNMGSGRELWIYSPAMYNTIFGPEDGWVLYKDVKVMHYESKQAKQGPLRRRAAHIATTALLIWNLSLILFCMIGEHSEEMLAGAVFGLLFGGMGLIFSITMMCVGRNRNLEAEVEAELQRSFFNNNSATVPHHGTHV